jgi:CPA1 family monovalent cation:H+ antiporter
VEITLTTIAAYGAFLVAERFETFGVLASLTAEIVIGNIGGAATFRRAGVAM